MRRVLEAIAKIPEYFVIAIAVAICIVVVIYLTGKLAIKGHIS